MSPVGLLDMKKLFQIFLFALFLCLSAQPALSSPAFEELLGLKAKLIQKSSSKTVDPVPDQIQKFGGRLLLSFCRMEG